MKAILIDPFPRIVQHVIVPDPNKNLVALATIIGCDWLDFTRVDDCMFISDDEALLKPPEDQAYWRLSFDVQRRRAGRVLIFGFDLERDEIAPPWMTARQLMSVVEWCDPPTEDEHADMLVSSLLSGPKR